MRCHADGPDASRYGVGTSTTDDQSIHLLLEAAEEQSTDADADGGSTSTSSTHKQIKIFLPYAVHWVCAIPKVDSIYSTYMIPYHDIFRVQLCSHNKLILTCNTA